MGRTALLTFAGLTLILLAAGTAAGQGGDPNDQADRWFTSEQTITFDHVPGGAPNEEGGPPQVTVNSTLRLHQFRYDGETYSADEFRSAYERNAIGDNAVERLESEVRSRFNDTLDQMLPLKGPPETTPAQLTDASLNAGATGRPYHPPLVFHMSGGGDLDLSAATGQEASPKKLGVALELGASLDFPFQLSAEPGQNLTVHVRSPAGLAWNATAAGGASEAGVVNHTVTNWKGATSQTDRLPLAVTDPAERAYRAERVDLDVIVDLKGVDVQLTSIPGGSLGEGKGSVTVDGKLAVVELPDSAPDSLSQAGVTHISADDIRLLIEEGLVDRSTIENRVNNLTEGFLSDTPERVDVVFSGGLVDETLQGAEASPNETAPPVRLEFHADVFVDLAFGGGGGGSQAITLHSLDRSFTFPSLKDFATTYQVILPKGVSLVDVKVAGDESPTTGVTDEGRDYFRLDVAEGGEQEATIQAAVTASFLWYHAPEIVILLLLLILIPIAVVAKLLTGGGGDEEPTRVEAPGPDE